MSKKDGWYKQCKYECKTDCGKMIGVSWLPEKFAKIGKKIYFNDPQEIWTVTHTYGKKRESFLMKHRVGYKHQREVSDI